MSYNDYIARKKIVENSFLKKIPLFASSSDSKNETINNKILSPNGMFSVVKNYLSSIKTILNTQIYEALRLYMYSTYPAGFDVEGVESYLVINYQDVIDADNGWAESYSNMSVENGYIYNNKYIHFFPDIYDNGELATVKEIIYSTPISISFLAINTSLDITMQLTEYGMLDGDILVKIFNANSDGSPILSETPVWENSISFPRGTGFIDISGITGLTENNLYCLVVSTDATNISSEVYFSIPVFNCKVDNKIYYNTSENIYTISSEDIMPVMALSFSRYASVTSYQATSSGSINHLLALYVDVDEYSPNNFWSGGVSIQYSWDNESWVTPIEVQTLSNSTMVFYDIEDTDQENVDGIYIKFVIDRHAKFYGSYMFYGNKVMTPEN